MDVLIQSTFATPTADCSGIPGGGLIVDSCGDCVAVEVDSDGDGFADSCDTCPGFNDNLDLDNDGLADDCDACPVDADNDADGDGVCGDVDVCEGYDDNNDFDSDGTPDACDETATGDMTLTLDVTSEGTANINYENNVDVYGFQFTVNGVTLTGADTGLSDVTYSAETGNVIGFDMQSLFLPAGEGVLVSLSFDPIVDGSTLSVSSVIASAEPYGNSIYVTGPEDADVEACANADSDSLCDVVDACPLDADNDADGDGVCGDDDCEG